jgi:hypothetical protein
MQIFSTPLARRALVAAWMLAAASIGAAAPTDSAAGIASDSATGSAAAALRERHAALAEALRNNPFQRPLHLVSKQTEGDLQGEIYAVVDHPFATVAAGLKGPDRWCDILILHVNVKQCRASGGERDAAVTISIGKKHEQAVADAYAVRLDYRIAASNADYLQVLLHGDSGPLGTKNYRIVFEAVPLDARRSFVHMSYSYGYGVAARLAMQGYLATIGRGKVGFTVVEQRPGAAPAYVDGVRGVVERNTMRYYLAIDAYLGALASPPEVQSEKRLRDWFAATERYPRQLHEVERDDYLDMKRKELRRQQAQASATRPTS